MVLYLLGNSRLDISARGDVMSAAAIAGVFLLGAHLAGA
jgi:hypothetical protein